MGILRRRKAMKWVAMGKDGAKTAIGAKALVVALRGLPVFEISESKWKERTLAVLSRTQPRPGGGFCLGYFSVDMGCSNSFTLRVIERETKELTNGYERKAGRHEVAGWYAVGKDGEETRVEADWMVAEFGGGLTAGMQIVERDGGPGIWFMAPTVPKEKKKCLFPSFVIPLGCSNSFDIQVTSAVGKMPAGMCSVPAGGGGKETGREEL